MEQDLTIAVNDSLGPLASAVSRHFTNGMGK